MADIPSGSCAGFRVGLLGVAATIASLNLVSAPAMVVAQEPSADARSAGSAMSAEAWREDVALCCAFTRQTATRWRCSASCAAKM